MTRIALDKQYLTIGELMDRWDRTRCDLQYVAENGKLDIHVRPIALGKSKRTPLCPADAYRLFGIHDQRIPIGKCKTEIGFCDMVVFIDDVKKFEQDNAAQKDDFVLLSPDYREFIIHGEKLRLGDKQAAIAKYLHEQFNTSNPWVHGKELMKIAGSESWKIQNLFGRNKNWRIAIASDGRGYYKFNL